jgi:predicted RNase H-like nuclease (RuvC/YqgF family)
MTAEDIKDDMDDAHSGMGSDEGARPGESEEDLKNRKRKERLEQNRISARESRKRKKTMIEELQRTVITLSRENKGLNERNETLRRQLMDIGAKVCFFYRAVASSRPDQGTLLFRHIGSW